MLKSWYVLMFSQANTWPAIIEIIASTRIIEIVESRFITIFLSLLYFLYLILYEVSSRGTLNTHYKQQWHYCNKYECS